jgi:hypothetical protein
LMTKDWIPDYRAFSHKRKGVLQSWIYWSGISKRGRESFPVTELRQ